MQFVERLVHISNNCLQSIEIRDIYYHAIAQVKLIRCTHTRKDKPNDLYVNWTCPELGGGNASLSYWLQKADTTNKKRHD